MYIAISSCVRDVIVVPVSTIKTAITAHPSQGDLLSEFLRTTHDHPPYPPRNLEIAVEAHGVGLKGVLYVMDEEFMNEMQQGNQLLGDPNTFRSEEQMVAAEKHGDEYQSRDQGAQYSGVGRLLAVSARGSPGRQSGNDLVTTNAGASRKNGDEEEVDARCLGSAYSAAHSWNDDSEDDERKKRPRRTSRRLGMAVHTKEQWTTLGDGAYLKYLETGVASAARLSDGEITHSTLGYGGSARARASTLGRRDRRCAGGSRRR